MKKYIQINLITAALMTGFLSAPVFAASVYESDYTHEIHGYQPYFPSVGVYLYQSGNNDTPYKAAENGGVKVPIKVGDTLKIPTYLTEDLYSLYYTWADRDGSGDKSDIEDKKKINLSVDWYLVDEGATEILPGVNAVLLGETNGVLATDGSIEPTYKVPVEAVGKKVGFRIKAWSEVGLPTEGEYLEVPNVAYLGRQTSSLNPSEKPTTMIPKADDESAKHPDITDEVVQIGSLYIVQIYDVTEGVEKATLVEDTDPIFVAHKYSASIQVWEPELKRYVDKTAALEKYMSWSLYQAQDNNVIVPIYENMTSLGMVNNIPEDADLLAKFNPDETPFTYVQEDLALIKSRFTAGDNTTFSIQNQNIDALTKTQLLPPNYSEQGLKLKVRLIMP